MAPKRETQKNVGESQRKTSAKENIFYEVIPKYESYPALSLFVAKLIHSVSISEVAPGDKATTQFAVSQDTPKTE
jgi:hypothetical protein